MHLVKIESLLITTLFLFKWYNTSSPVWYWPLLLVKKFDVCVVEQSHQYIFHSFISFCKQQRRCRDKTTFVFLYYTICHLTPFKKATRLTTHISHQKNNDDDPIYHKSRFKSGTKPKINQFVKSLLNYNFKKHVVG